MKIHGVMLGLFFLSAFFLTGADKTDQGSSKGEVYTNSIGMKLIKVPDQDLHYIGMYEVTQAQYYQVMRKNTTRPQPWTEIPTAQRGDDYPVSNVTWIEAARFCHYLNQLEKKSKNSKPNYYYRLPTEQEWETACRAGTASPYFFGHDKKHLGQYAWFKGNTQKEPYPHKVGQKKPNRWGFYDVYGNVAEWCLEGRDPKSRRKALRGGGYIHPEWMCTSHSQNKLYRAFKDYPNGFRVIYSIE